MEGNRDDTGIYHHVVTHWFCWLVFSGLVGIGMITDDVFLIDVARYIDMLSSASIESTPVVIKDRQIRA